MSKENKLYQIKVKYVGHSGNVYNEELNFTKEQEAIKAYELFANNVDGSRGYKISFYDINEVPPKVSVKVDSATVLSFKVQETKDGKKSTKTDDIDMTTSYDAIIETSNIVDPTLDYHLNKYDSDVCLSYNANS